MVGGSSEALARAMADQVMAHAIGLAMHNAVAQQQQLYMLRNAMTTAAVNAILEASPEDALRYASEALPGDDIAQTLERLRALMESTKASRPEPGA
ncbi:RebB family R body protein [Dyella sp. 7MK23]|uniref:RebB family R body protein n=2 Tax=Dyella acidiphila TaxID=2775866 RepID=A0ABR9G9M1_9GAMM|nr:RebB family R body protein [Dyella acidiphila]MBE1160726.1 RebB family R body protein [Dyella acidiphila]